MSTVTFDTLKASRHLQAAGIAEAHAEAIVGSMATAFSNTVATKAEVAALDASTKAEFANLKASTKAEFANLKAEIFRALWIQGAGVIGLIVGLTKLL